MKRTAAAFLASSLLACSHVAKKEDLQAIHTEIVNARADLTTKIDANLRVYNDLVNRHTELEKRVVEMEVLVKALASRTDDLSDQVRLLKAQVATLGQAPSPPPGPGDPPRPPEAPKKLDEILREVETTVTQLRNGKLPLDQAATLLKPYARDAAPRILQEIRAHLVNPEYSKQLETILAGFPPDSLRVALGTVLLERGLRDTAARVVGATKDKDLGKILEEYVATPDEDFRLLVGDSLVLCRNPKGIPLLVLGLKSRQLDTRTIAIAALKRLNAGDARGYRAALSPEQNAEALKAWEEWAEKFGPVIFE
jgi:HEAT repeat protein